MGSNWKMLIKKALFPGRKFTNKDLFKKLFWRYVLHFYSP